MTRAREQIMVAFEGDGAGEGELSWGQKENWATITALASWLPLGGVTALPEGMTVETILGTLRYAMSRYPSLRTRLRLDADRPIQVVHASGQLPLDVVDAGDDDPAEVAEAVCKRYRDTGLDFTAEWPVRMATILHRGRPTHMAAMISHLAADAAGLGVMLREMAAQDAAPVDGLAPLSQAQWQRSPAGRRHGAAAMRYWEEVFRSIDPDRFHNPGAADQPRYWHGEFDSWALLPPVRELAAASGSGTSTVLMTLLAVGLHQVNGINPVVIRPIVGNRFRPGLADVVCTVAQAGICVLDVADVPFGEALQRVQRSVMKGYKYAYFDHEDMVALRTHVERERGVELDTGLFINDRHDVSAAARAVQSAGAPPRDSADGPPPSALRWLRGHDDPPHDKLFVEVDDIPGGLRISFHVDSAAISRADAEKMVRRMDEIATAAAAELAPASSGTVSSSTAQPDPV
ncbi:MAG TPA: condensation domain-containing protein [Actinocrinis sp.]|uniref:condensation domain-containing protein n=1 Tax=Actinocrinis sp. TaxID=1920516 RepID=UPI002DDCD7B2|nr:condensation domain-containing protein [Actinocrinis sp.]HEV2342862.1 condensation domain-containing protein [Actinocrinis sp.]